MAPACGLGSAGLTQMRGARVLPRLGLWAADGTSRGRGPAPPLDGLLRPGPRGKRGDCHPPAPWDCRLAFWRLHHVPRGLLWPPGPPHQPLQAMNPRPPRPWSPAVSSSRYSRRAGGLDCPHRPRRGSPLCFRGGDSSGRPARALPERPPSGAWAPGLALRLSGRLSGTSAAIGGALLASFLPLPPRHWGLFLLLC